MNVLNIHDDQRRRAERVMHLLQQLWGDDLPPGPEPELTVLIDAVAGDDHMGAQDGYVVQSDRLSYDALAVLLRRSTAPALTAGTLPRELLTRVFAATHHPGTRHGSDRSTSGDVPHHSGRLSIHRWPDEYRDLDRDAAQPRTALRQEPPEGRRTHLTLAGEPRDGHGQLRSAPLPSASPSPAVAAQSVGTPAAAGPVREIGTWHLDADRQVLSWDDSCAAVLGRTGAPRFTSVLEELEEWTYPQDRPSVAAGFERCIHEAHPHEARFRARHPRGGWIACRASGQRVIDADGKVHVVGVLQHDTETAAG
ncbi:PAS domain-containing protein [Kineococcus endophyticus]|uniref:PAS domain-containing protein n=1 Tax=Kineococcus endophyticus TaxID=1181883 RepID=A0ABV3P4I9_9ACTN